MKPAVVFTILAVIFVIFLVLYWYFYRSSYAVISYYETYIKDTNKEAWKLQDTVHILSSSNNMSAEEIEKRINLTLSVSNKCVGLFEKSTEKIPGFIKMVVNAWFLNPRAKAYGIYGIDRVTTYGNFIPFMLLETISDLGNFSKKNKTSKEYVSYVLNTSVSIMTVLRQKYNKRIKETLDQPGVKELFGDTTMAKIQVDEHYLDLIDRIKNKINTVYSNEVDAVVKANEQMVNTLEYSTAAAIGKTPEQIKTEYDAFITFRDTNLKPVYNEVEKLYGPIKVLDISTKPEEAIKDSIVTLETIVNMFNKHVSDYQKMLYMADNTTAPTGKQSAITELSPVMKVPEQTSKKIFLSVEKISKGLSDYSKLGSSDKVFVSTNIKAIGDLVNKHIADYYAYTDSMYKSKYSFSVYAYTDEISHSAKENVKKNMIAIFDNIYHKDIDSI